MKENTAKRYIFGVNTQNIRQDTRYGKWNLLYTTFKSRKRFVIRKKKLK